MHLFPLISRRRPRDVKSRPFSSSHWLKFPARSPVLTSWKMNGSLRLVESKEDTSLSLNELFRYTFLCHAPTFSFLSTLFVILLLPLLDLISSLCFWKVYVFSFWNSNHIGKPTHSLFVGVLPLCPIPTENCRITDWFKGHVDFSRLSNAFVCVKRPIRKLIAVGHSIRRHAVIGEMVARCF